MFNTSDIERISFQCPLISRMIAQSLLVNPSTGLRYESAPILQRADMVINSSESLDSTQTHWLTQPSSFSSGHLLLNSSNGLGPVSMNADLHVSNAEDGSTSGWRDEGPMFPDIVQDAADLAATANLSISNFIAWFCSCCKSSWHEQHFGFFIDPNRILAELRSSPGTEPIELNLEVGFPIVAFTPWSGNGGTYDARCRDILGFLLRQDRLRLHLDNPLTPMWGSWLESCGKISEVDWNNLVHNEVAFPLENIPLETLALAVRVGRDAIVASLESSASNTLPDTKALLLDEYHHHHAHKKRKRHDEPLRSISSSTSAYADEDN
jgi:hypothetical protein